VAALKPHTTAIDAVIKKMIVTTMVMLFSMAQELSIALYRKTEAIDATMHRAIHTGVDIIFEDLTFICFDIIWFFNSLANTLISAESRLRAFQGDGNKQGRG
jgi:hypothetical protein